MRGVVFPPLWRANNGNDQQAVRWLGGQLNTAAISAGIQGGKQKRARGANEQMGPTLVIVTAFTQTSI